MNPSLLCILIVGLVAPSFIRAAPTDDAVKDIDDAKQVLELVVRAAEHNADSVKDRTVRKMKSVRDGYVENVKDVQAQLKNAIEKLISSYKNNYEIVKKNLQRNIEQLDNQIKPNIDSSLANIKKLIGKRIVKDPAAQAQLDKLLEHYDSQAKDMIVADKETFRSLGEELEKEYKQGLESFKSS